MPKIPKKLLLALSLLASCMACLEEPKSHSLAEPLKQKPSIAEPSKEMLSMCPSDGANLFLKCADGKEKVFGLGYGNEPIYVRKKGIWSLKAASEFCEGEPIKIDFYFRKGHLQVGGRKANNNTWESIWRSASSDCVRFEHNIQIGYTTLKIESIPSTRPKPSDPIF